MSYNQDIDLNKSKLYFEVSDNIYKFGKLVQDNFDVNYCRIHYEDGTKSFALLKSTMIDVLLKNGKTKLFI